MSKRLGFTLAEIMIVLTIIGILTAILLPVAINSAPDENVMKFKKGNNTLGTVIRELVNSDKYYANGDLGIRADGTLIDGKHDGDEKYFCSTFSDVISVKNQNCADKNNSCYNLNKENFVQLYSQWGQTLEEAKKTLDKVCLECGEVVGAEIISNDNITYYQTSPNYTFGMPWYEDYELTVELNQRFFSPPNGPVVHGDDNGFDRMYKIFCMDIDGINKGEDPFGYGIRADGKILLGARADEWLQKSIQKGE